MTTRDAITEGLEAPPRGVAREALRSLQHAVAAGTLNNSRSPNGRAI